MARRSKITSGQQGKRLGKKKWQRKVADVVERLAAALQPEYIVLGGGNAEKIERLPRRTRRGRNNDAFVGGFKLWGKGTISDRSVRTKAARALKKLRSRRATGSKPQVQPH